MPRHGGQRQNYNNNSGSRYTVLRDHFDHDDREVKRDRNNTRRVSFKNTQIHPKAKGRLNEHALRARLAEDDEDMGDIATSSKFDEIRHTTRRKGSPIPKGKFGHFRKITPSPFGWYQVTIKSGHLYSKDDIIRALLNAISPNVFIPLYWRIERNCVIFFVDDFAVAEQLQQVDRQVQLANGFRLFLRVRSGFPNVTVDDQFKEKMKLVMAKRYNAQTGALNMSKFHADPDFRDTFCGLFRNPIMAAALDIIEQNIPELKALNLNENFISSLEAFKNIAQRLPQLTILHLADNKLPSLAHLLVLRNVPIVDLMLKNNPLRDRYQSHDLYVSEVRRKFPKIVKLDGLDLQPQILFDVNDSSKLPAAKASFLCDTAGADIIRQFLEQYFIIFDSDNRQPLLDAYHEQAMMSMSVPPISQAGRLSSFWKFNRNLLRGNDEHAKIRQLKVGRLAVVSTLAEWPKTQHDPQSFSVDLTLFTPKIICFTVAGLLKEFESGASSSNNSSNGEVRYFQRQFTIVPAGGGFCIRNELILVTSATNEQARSFMRSASTAATPISSPAAGGLQNRLQQHQGTMAPTMNNTMSMAPNVASVAGQLDENTKIQMVQAMSTQSNMNVEWSRKCLEETNWDYSHAAFVFEKLHKENKIPPEAFVK